MQQQQALEFKEVAKISPSEIIPVEIVPWRICPPPPAVCRVDAIVHPPGWLMALSLPGGVLGIGYWVLGARHDTGARTENYAWPTGDGLVVRVGKWAAPWPYTPCQGAGHHTPEGGRSHVHPPSVLCPAPPPPLLRGQPREQEYTWAGSVPACAGPYGALCGHPPGGRASSVMSCTCGRWPSRLLGAIQAPSGRPQGASSPSGWHMGATLPSGRRDGRHQGVSWASSRHRGAVWVPALHLGALRVPCGRPLGATWPPSWRHVGTISPFGRMGGRGALRQCRCGSCSGRVKVGVAGEAKSGCGRGRSPASP